MSDIIEPLRFFNVQKVLPAVYGDELSYYELLAKMEHKVNKLVTQANKLGVDVSEVVEAVENIKNLPEIDAQVKALQAAADTIQETLDALPSYAEFTTLSQKVESNTNGKVPFPIPPNSKYGTNGQVLRTNGDGSTQWQDPITPSDAQAETYINAWLNAHPDATTTVLDNSITAAKLSNDLKTLLQYSNTAANDTNIYFFNTYENMGTAATIWKVDAFIPTDSFTVEVVDTEGLSGSDCLRIRLRYADSTNETFSVKSDTKKLRIKISKEVLAADIVLVRADSNVPEDTFSRWSIIVYDFVNKINAIENTLNALYSGVNINKIYSNLIYYRSDSPSLWVTNIQPPSSNFGELWVIFADAIGLSDNNIGRIRIVYTDDSYTYTDIQQADYPTEIYINKNKEIRTIDIVLYGDESNNEHSAYAILYSTPNDEYEYLENITLPKLELKNRAYYASGPVTTSFRLGTQLLKSGGLVNVSVESGYESAFVTYTDIYENYTSGSWTSEPYTICTNDYFAIVIRKNDDSNITIDEGSALKINESFVPTDNTKYYYTGEKITFLKKHPLAMSITNSFRVIPAGFVTQAGAIYNNILIQGYGSNSSQTLSHMQVFNIETETLLFELDINCGHFGSASFSNEFYDATDTIPLLYVCDYWRKMVHVVRVTESAATIVKELVLPNDIGYHNGCVINPANGYLYVFGYSQNTYLNPQDNNCIITVFDSTALTSSDVQDSYIPLQIEQYEIPFIYCYQDFAFHDNNIFIASGFTQSESPATILVFDINKKAITSKFTSTSIGGEPEMIDLYEQNEKYVLYYQRHNTYYNIIDFR